MIASIINNNHPRLLLLLGVVCMTMLALLMSTLTIFTPIASVHAMGLPSADPMLCVSAPTTAHCTNQDPIAQGCSSDAQTLAYEDFLDPSTGNSLARAERRYSPKCHTYWGRIVEPVTGKRGLSIVVASQGWAATGLNDHGNGGVYPHGVPFLSDSANGPLGWGNQPEEWRRSCGQWRFRAGGNPLRTPFPTPMFLRAFPGQASSFLSHTMMPALVNYSWLPTKALRGVTVCWME